MAQTLTRLLVHAIFSTKNRTNLIKPDIEPELYAYIGGICLNAESPLLGAGGTANHLHLLVSLSRAGSLADLMMDVKKDSSKWIKTKGRNYKDFHWQGGYGAFSVSESNRGAAIRYIQRQEEHHRRMTFQEEYRLLCAKHGIEIDERYVWD